MIIEIACGIGLAYATYAIGYCLLHLFDVID